MTKDKQETETKKEIKQIFYLISKANHPITISYNNDEIVLSPRQRISFTDRSKLTINPTDAKNLRIVTQEN